MLSKPNKIEPVFGKPLSELPLYLPAEFDTTSTIPQIVIDDHIQGGNEISVPPCHSSLEKEKHVPEFVMRCLKKIETMSTFVGLYRINGDAGKVKELR